MVELKFKNLPSIKTYILLFYFIIYYYYLFFLTKQTKLGVHFSFKPFFPLFISLSHWPHYFTITMFLTLFSNSKAWFVRALFLPSMNLVRFWDPLQRWSATLLLFSFLSKWRSREFTMTFLLSAS